MLRRTFAQTLLFSLSLPFWPFPNIKKKINHSELIKRLLKEGKDFSIGNQKEEWKCNIIRKKRRSIDAKQLLQNRLNMSAEEKLCKDKNNHIKRPLTKSINQWYKFKIRFSKND